MIFRTNKRKRQMKLEGKGGAADVVNWISTDSYLFIYKSNVLLLF